MHIRRIRELLKEHESTTLDFKRDQYRLTTDDEKGEFIKDLLAFANTPRAADANIIVGVAEEARPPHSINGITEQRFDHHLQELVNSKLNRPITFLYETRDIDGHTIGIITIKRKQHPPHHLIKDFGKLTKNTVYIRRGSSTAIAKPDEITSLTGKTRKRPNPATLRASLRVLSLTVMHRKDEIITVRAGRGIPGFAYNPPERHTFSLGEYERLDAKLLITPTTPLVIVTALSTATITTADNNTIQLERITVDEHAETIDVATARVIRFKSEQRVKGDVLEPSRDNGLAATINLATARGQMLSLEHRLSWDRRNESFTSSNE